MTTRTVRYIVSKALRRVAEETDLSAAPQEAYNDAFDIFIDMLNEWLTRNYVIFNPLPTSLNDGISSSDPIPTLIDNLALRIAPHFLFEVTSDMKFQAGNSLRIIRNRQCALPLWRRPCNMPRGSGNYYYFYNLDCIDCDSTVDADDSTVVTQQGIPIRTSVTGDCS